MSRKNQDDLAASLAERKREKPKIYRELADEAKAAAISADVSFKRKSLMDSANRPRVNLNNLEDVKSRTNDFLVACETASVVPTFLGLSVALGGSRQWLYKFLQSNPGTPSAEFLETTRDVLADALINSSLCRTTDAATTIFALKNLHGFSDRMEIVPKAEDPGPLGPTMDPEELRRRIEDNIVDDEWEDE